MFDIRPMMHLSSLTGKTPSHPEGETRVPSSGHPWRSTKAYDREAYDKGTRVAVARVSDDATQLVWIKEDACNVEEGVGRVCDPAKAPVGEG
jgi:hypothetical protein